MRKNERKIMINKIGEFRLSQNMGQSQFAKLLQVSQGYVSKIEKGIQAPCFTFLKNLNIIFDYDASQLFEKDALVPHEVILKPEQIEKKQMNAYLWNKGVSTPSIAKASVMVEAEDIVQARALAALNQIFGIEEKPSLILQSNSRRPKVWMFPLSRKSKIEMSAERIIKSNLELGLSNNPEPGSSSTDIFEKTSK